MDRRTADVLRGFAAALALLVFVLGIPAGLIVMVGPPWPTVMPSIDELGRFLTRGEVTSWTLVKALSAGVWLAWLDLTASVVAEAVAVARGRAALRLPGPGVLRMAAANLVASAALLLSSPVRPALADDQPPGLTTTLAAAPDEMRDLRLGPVATPETGGPYASMHPVAPTFPSSAADPRPTRPAPTPLVEGDGEVRAEARTLTDAEGPTWVVQRRDTLWGIAEQTLGDGFRWRDIHHLNVGRAQPDGRAVQPGDDQIDVGWILRLPPDAHVPDDAADEQTATADEDTAGSVTVEPGDTLWDLSEEHLGDPFRWPSLYEANAGREQPEGRRLTEPDLIYPGWTLDLPAKARESHAGEEGQQRRADAEGSAAVGTPESPDADGPDSESQSDRGLLDNRVGRVPDGVQQVDEGGSADSPDVHRTGADHADEGERRRPDAANDVSDELLAVAGAGAVAAGIALTLDRIRRAQRRRRPPGRHIRLPEGANAKVEQRIRGLADVVGAADVAHALSSVSLHRRREDDADPLADIVLVSTSASDLALHLAEPDVQPPPGWRCEDGGATWVLPRETEADKLTPTWILSPLLVSLGTTAAGRRRVQLNLRRAGILGVEGSRADRRTIMLSFAAELATTAGRPLQVVLAGQGDGFEAFEWIDCVGDALDVISLFERRVAELQDGDLSDLEPIIGLIVEPLARSTVERLRGIIAAAQGTVAAVIPAADGLAFTLDRMPTGWRLLPDGIDLQPLELSAEEQERVGELVAQAKTGSYVPPPDQHDPMAPDLETTNGSESPEPNGDADDREKVVQARPPASVETGPRTDDENDRVIDLVDESEDDAPDVEGSIVAEKPVAAPAEEVAGQDGSAEAGAAPEVRILGSVNVTGVEKWATAKSQELVAYLAMHRRGVNGDALMEALWPRTEPNRTRLTTEVARARQALGTSPDGEHYLPPPKHGVYRLHPAIRTDYDRFLDLARAANDRPANATGLLRTALQLIDDRPLSGPADDYAWASFGTHSIQQTIADAAHKLAQLELEEGNPSGAVWAARQGLKADPLFEALYRDLMLAAAQAGNTAEIPAIMDELRKEISDQAGTNDADDWVDPETLKLFRELTGRGQRADARDPSSHG